MKKEARADHRRRDQQHPKHRQAGRGPPFAGAVHRPPQRFEQPGAIQPIKEQRFAAVLIQFKKFLGGQPTVIGGQQVLQIQMLADNKARSGGNIGVTKGQPGLGKSGEQPNQFGHKAGFPTGLRGGPDKIIAISQREGLSKGGR